MKYEVKSWEKDKSQTDGTVQKQLLYIVSGIVGDIYSFTRVDTLYVDVPDVKTIKQSDVIYEAAAKDFIANKYPNT